jgi:hypothetical protein
MIATSHPDITLYGTDETAHRRRMVRDLEQFLAIALGSVAATPASPRAADSDRQTVGSSSAFIARGDAGIAATSASACGQPVYSRSSTTPEDPRC